MKIKIVILIGLCVISSKLFGQFVVSISTQDTICRDSIITFTAMATNGGAPVTDATFTWSFGDGTSPVSGFMLDTVTNQFVAEGGFIVKVDASSGANKDYALLKIQPGIKPDFNGTNSDRDEPICKGQEIFFTGKYQTKIWKYNIPDTFSTAVPSIVSNTTVYNSNFDYRIFNENQTITDALNISIAGVTLEHSNTQNIKIELKCPSGTTIMLKDFGGPDKYFGIPIDDEASLFEGTGYSYTWTNSPTFASMNTLNPTGTAFIEGSYTPQEPFSNLIGCPLNGKWEIIVSDNQSLDNGFVFEAQMSFNPTLLIPTSWQYSNTYKSPEWIGNGISATSGSGYATATPVIRGTINYTFRVLNSFGCPQDSTNVVVSVTQPTFTANPQSSEINKEISFTNTTEWATTFRWNFADGTPEVYIEDPTHVFSYQGNYIVKLIAGTSDGCVDTGQVSIEIKVPPFKFGEIPTVFTPNADGNNDNYKLDSGSIEGVFSLDCWIYNRWGKKVTEWHSVEEATKGWDGKIKGGPDATPGVYYYHIIVIGFDNQKQEKNGFFHLFK